MLTLRRIAAAFRRFFSGNRHDCGLHDEVQSYAAMLADEQRAAGVPDAEARRRALAEVGGVESVKERVRDERAGVWLELLWRDVVHATRGLMRNPAFAITAVATLALGMAVNVTTFAIVDAAAFRPLPYERPDDLVYIRHVLDPREPVAQASDSMAWDEWRLWRSESSLFADAFGWTFPQEVRWTDRDKPLWLGKFTEGTVRALGIAPLAGRSFTADDAGTGARVLLISEQTWKRDFAGSPSAIGATMTVDGVAYSVIGVMPAAFRFGPGGWGRADGWTVLPERQDSAVAGSNMTTAAFRLRSGVSLEAADRQVAAMANRVQQAAPYEYGIWTGHVSRIADDRSAARGTLNRWLLGLLAMSIAVLIVGCANVANLLVVRAHQRAPELAMRTALGATRGRLLRLLLIEGAVLAVASVTLALAASAAGVNAIINLIPPLMRQGMFEAGEPSIGGRVLLYSLAAGTVAIILAGAWPAWRGAPLAARSRTEAPQRQRVGAALQGAEVALTLIVVAAAITMSTSFWRTVRHDLGFESAGLGWLAVSWPIDRAAPRDTPDARLATVLDTVRAVPGVTAAALGQPPLLPVGADVRRADDVSGTPLSVDLRVGIGPGYFGVLGMHIREGREILREDVAAGARVAIIDESAARHLFSTGSAVGQRIRLGRRDGGPEFEVIGVVNDASTSDFNRRTRAGGVYLPLGQLSPPASAFIDVRASRNIGDVLAETSRALSALPSMRVSSPQTTATFLESKETFSSPRFFLMLTVTFAVLTLIVGSVGVYGLLSFDVGRRRRDIGIRMALGAPARRLQWSVAVRMLVPVAAGMAAGTALWLAIIPRAAPFIFGVEPRDARIVAASAALLAIAALVACVAPLRRAVGADVLNALKND
jgi:predicted permease